MTRNPWKPKQGSSGSSAGSAAATAAGLVGFALGDLGFNRLAVHPLRGDGPATDLRSSRRDGVMALSWTMDKVGPIARSVEDCALVFEVIAGPDGRDATLVDRPFDWGSRPDPRKLRLGYVPALFDEAPEKGGEETRALERAALDALRKSGVALSAVTLPKLPVEALAIILTAEAGAAFDDFTRSGRVREMVRQGADAWPNLFVPPASSRRWSICGRTGSAPCWCASGRRRCAVSTRSSSRRSAALSSWRRT